MQRQHTQLTGLLGAILLTSGLASSITQGAETLSEPKQQTQTKEAGAAQTTSEASAAAQTKKDEQPEMVEVRISLPSGKVIVRMEPVRKISARRDLDFQVSANHTLSDGSRISVGGHRVGGGSNSASVKVGGSSSGGGGGGGGSSSGGGGGGGSSAHGGGGSASSSGVSSFTKPTSSASEGIDTDGIIEGAQTGNTTEDTASTAQNGSSSSSSSSSRGGVFQVTKNTSNYAAQGTTGSSSSSGSTSDSSSSSGTSGSSDSSGASGGTTSQGDAEQTPSTVVVPTVGAPDYDDDGAIGGQTVEFYDAGMSAAVIGNMIYFNGVEFVQGDQDFTVVTGTMIGPNSVIMDDQRPSNAGALDLSTFTTNSCPIRIEFDSDTVVNLVMQSQSSDPSNPSRIQRTWTVRVR